jgi:hypothetical protein
MRGGSRRASEGFRIIRRTWAFCSYTNDVARAAKSCQAPFEAKTGSAE